MRLEINLQPGVKNAGIIVSDQAAAITGMGIIVNNQIVCHCANISIYIPVETNGDVVFPAAGNEWEAVQVKHAIPDGHFKAP
jgi:hypothetical protein